MQSNERILRDAITANKVQGTADDISEKKFRAYVGVQNSGATNMWDSKMVTKLSGNVLTRADVILIIRHYEELQAKYG